jgi:hypothetical protein
VSGRAVAIAALVLAGASPRLAAAEAAPVYLIQLDVESEAGLALEPPLAARLELHPGRAAKVKSLREWFPRAAARGDAVTVVLREGALAAGRPTAAQRRPSFFVDADDPGVVALRDALGPVAPGEAPARIAALVGRHIEKKDLARLLDRASTVAARREGDCTEHAVLTAAVARAAGLAARVVFGVALVADQSGGIHGLGHAWAEIHDGRRWRVSDATDPDRSWRVLYLPLGVLRDEGPGYAVSAWGALTPLDVKRVVLTRAR